MANVGSSTPPPEAMRRGIGTGTFIAVVVVVAILALLGGIGIGKLVYGPASTAGKQYLVVGTNIPFPPFEDYNYSSGNYVGFDIAFAQMFANATHRTLVIQNFADFSVLLTTVGSGGVDMAAPAITESGHSGTVRNATMSFSNPYYDANQAVLVTSSSTLTCAANVCTAPDLKTKTVAVQTGTTSESWVHDFLAPIMADNATQVKHFTTVDTEITALRAGAVDAVIIDSGPATSIAAASGGALKVTGTIVTGELYGFAVAHGDPEGLLAVINGVISQAQSDGTYAKLIKIYFG
jgi:polar amino acid transport system substrate-binding protein